MQMSRRPCKDPTDPNCKDGRPPIADYPKYSSVITPYSDLLHWDVKIPSEHTIEGEIFDGEIQMFHTHYGGRVSSIGIPIRATEDGYNPDMQDIIDQFQLVYDEHEFNCLNDSGRRHLRNNDKQQRRAREMLRDLVHANTTTATVTPEETLKIRKRQLQSMKFDPYSESFMRDIFFYRYDGSITEPPCLTITWWVMIHPMIISFEQLFQLKMLLFTHIDEDCTPTSVHNEDQEVTRPIFPLGDDRDIQRCEPGDFVDDVAKGRGEGNQC